MKNVNENRPSEIIGEFLRLIERSHREFTENERAYKELDKKTSDWAHKFEFARDKGERNKLGTAYHKERQKRREYKDMAKLYEAIHEFAISENNKPAIKRLKGMLSRQKNTDNYLFGDREYKAGENDGNDS